MIINFFKFMHLCLLEKKKKKVKVGNDQEMAQSEINFHSKNLRWEKTKLTIRYLY